MCPLDDILVEGSKFQYSMFISFPQFIYCSHDEVYFLKLSCLIAADGGTLHAFQMDTIQRLLCITFMTSQSHLWRSCCIVMSRGPWLLRRCFKRGFGDHDRRRRGENVVQKYEVFKEIYILTSMITWVDYIGMCVLRKIFMWEKFALRVSRD